MEKADTEERPYTCTYLRQGENDVENLKKAKKLFLQHICRPWQWPITLKNDARFRKVHYATHSIQMDETQYLPSIVHDFAKYHAPRALIAF